MKEIGYDKRPRFGWTDDLDADPMYIFEEPVALAETNHPVVVIPLPKMVGRIRVFVRKIVKRSIQPLWAS